VGPLLREVHYYVIEGNRAAVGSAVLKAREAGNPVGRILTDGLIAAIKEVSERFERSSVNYFL